MFIIKEGLHARTVYKCQKVDLIKMPSKFQEIRALFSVTFFLRNYVKKLYHTMCFTVRLT